MANIFRLVILGLFGVFFSGVSFAVVFEYKVASAYPSTWHRSKAAACAEYASRAERTIVSTESVCSTLYEGAYPVNISYNVREVPDDPPPGGECIANSEKVNGICVCKKGFKSELGSCMPDGKALCQTFAAVEGMMGGMRGKESSFAGELAHGSKVCVPGGWGDGIPDYQGCRMEFDRTMLAANPDGSKTSYGSLEMSGSASDPNDYSCIAGDGVEPTEPKPPAKPACENGSKGQVNGVEVCVPRQGNNGVETDSKKETETETDTEKVNKKDDSKTVCVNGKCTTTTTTTTTTTNKTTGTSTTSTSTKTDVQGKGDFCKGNPKDAQCNGTGTGTGGGGSGGDGDGEDGPKSAFGGSCASGFTCEGDAVQCAVARQQHVRACKLFDDPSPESLLYESNKEKTGSQLDDLEGSETVNLSGRIDQTDILGGGSGASDLNITVAGSSVTLPFSKLNPYLNALGNLLVGVSMLLAFRIVGRG